MYIASVGAFPQMDEYVPVPLGSLITEDGECTTKFRTIRASLQKIWKSHSIPILTKIRLMKAVV